MPTQREVATWERTMQQVARVRPDMNRAVLELLDTMRDYLSDEIIDEWVQSGNVDELVNGLLIDPRVVAASHRVRMQVFLVLLAGGQFMLNRLPRVRRPAFNVLSASVWPVVQRVDQKILAALRVEVAAVIRNAVMQLIQQGATRAGAGVRAVVGLSVSQAADVARFRAALLAGDAPRALRYARRDPAFDAAVRAGQLTASQVERMVTAYRRRRIALNAETIARTAALDAFKSGQQEAIVQAVAQGMFGPEGVLMKTWVNMGDDRVRDEHQDGSGMGGQTVEWDRAYSNGDMVPGESSWNCRCVSHFSLRAI